MKPYLRRALLILGVATMAAGFNVESGRWLVILGAVFLSLFCFTLES